MDSTPARKPPREFQPTPQQIEAACEIIRAGWTEEERQKRWLGRRAKMPGYEFPLYSLRDLAESMADKDEQNPWV